CLVSDRRDRIGRLPQSHSCTSQALSEDELIGRYAGDRVESSEKMVRAHRGIASKLPQGQWFFRLCLDPAKDLIHPTFPPRAAFPHKNAQSQTAPAVSCAQGGPGTLQRQTRCLNLGVSERNR